MAVKPTKYQTSAVLKALLGKFKITDNIDFES